MAVRFSTTHQLKRGLISEIYSSDDLGVDVVVGNPFCGIPYMANSDNRKRIITSIGCTGAFELDNAGPTN